MSRRIPCTAKLNQARSHGEGSTKGRLLGTAEPGRHARYACIGFSLSLCGPPRLLDPSSPDSKSVILPGTVHDRHEDLDDGHMRWRSLLAESCTRMWYAAYHKALFKTCNRLHVSIDCRQHIQSYFGPSDVGLPMIARGRVWLSAAWPINSPLLIILPNDWISSPGSVSYIWHISRHA